MRDQDDRAYFAQRAEQERQRANAARDNTAALIHLSMADAYARKARSDGAMPRMRSMAG